METNIEKECINPVISQELGDFLGTIVTFDYNNQLSLWISNSGQKLILGKIEILDGALSNGQELAYLDADLDQLIVISSTGEKLTTIKASEHWVEVLGWIGDEKVLIGDMPFTIGGGWQPPSTTLILDLATGQYQELLPDYPEMDYVPPFPDFGRYGYSLTAYDPTLTRVVYPSYKDGGALILWDLVNKRELIHLITLFPWGTPEWKADGTSFIISLPPQYTDLGGNIYKIVEDNTDYIRGSDFFMINRDGEVRRLTYLTTNIKAEQHGYTWSPDQKQVAFWMKTNDDSQWSLAILNVETGQITNYCVGGGDGSLDIIWFPDGKQLISTYAMPDYDSTHETRILLINIKEKTAKVVPGNEIVVGWMGNNN